MNFSVVKDFCLCLEFDEMEKILLDNEKIENKNDNYESVCEMADILNFQCYDTDNGNGFIMYDLEWRTKLKHIKNGIIFALHFDRDTLFERYEDYTDIYTELYSKLKNQGINMTMEQIKQNCVLLEGVEFYD